MDDAVTDALAETESPEVETTGVESVAPRGEDEPGAESGAEPESGAAAEPGVAVEVEVDEEPVDNPYLRPGQWFVVHTQSGYEKKVKTNLEARISSMHMEDKIYEVVIPMEDVPEFKNGRKVIVQKKVFPGYLLVRCEMTDDSWYVVRNTPGVTGFVGQGRLGQKPTPTFLKAGDVMHLHIQGLGDQRQRVVEFKM